MLTQNTPIVYSPLVFNWLTQLTSTTLTAVKFYQIKNYIIEISHERSRSIAKGIFDPLLTPANLAFYENEVWKIMSAHRKSVSRSTTWTCELIVFGWTSGVASTSIVVSTEIQSKNVPIIMKVLCVWVGIGVFFYCAFLSHFPIFLILHQHNFLTIIESSLRAFSLFCGSRVAAAPSDLIVASAHDDWLNFPFNWTILMGNDFWKYRVRKNEDLLFYIYTTCHTQEWKNRASALSFISLEKKMHAVFLIVNFPLWSIFRFMPCPLWKI